MKDSLHLLNSDSEQNITGPERSLPAAFPPTDFVLQCFRLVNLVSLVQVLRDLKDVEPSQFSVSGKRLRRPLSLIGKRYGVRQDLFPSKKLRSFSRPVSGSRALDFTVECSCDDSHKAPDY